MTKTGSKRVLATLLLCAALCLGLCAGAYAAVGGGYGGSGYVSFESNGGSGWMNTYYPDTQPWYVPDNEFTWAGYSFTGWGLAAEGPVVYRPGDRAYSSDNMTLYAQWGPMSQAELEARYTPRVDKPSSYNVNATVDPDTGARYMTAKLGWSKLDDAQDFTIGLNLGSPSGPRVPALSRTFSTRDGSVTTSWSTSYATVAAPFLADGEEQTITGGEVNGLLDGDVVYATVASHFEAGDCPGNPVFFVCELPNTSPADTGEVSWFESSGSGTVVYNDYSVTVTLLEDTVLPAQGLTLGNASCHINMNTHSLTGTLNNGQSEVYVEHLTGDGPVLACYGWNEQTLVFDNYVYLNGSGQHAGSLTATLGDYSGFGYDSAYMMATVTNGASAEDLDVTGWGYSNAQSLAVYEIAELDEAALAAYTPKNVTVTPQEDGLIVECDYEPAAHVININVDVLLSDGSAARVISDSSSGSKDQVMKLEGDRQSLFIAARHLSNGEAQEISGDGEQKVINGYKDGDSLSVTMNFEVGGHLQATPWSAPPVAFAYGSSAIGATFKQGNNATVARQFLPEIAVIMVSSPLELTYNGEWQTLDYEVTLTANGRVLEPGVDYTEEYINNYRPGEATLAVIGQGGYSGRMTQQFTISGIDLASEAVSATLASDSAVYSGSRQTPAVMVVCDGRIMNESSEYYVEYSDNINAGMATVILTPGYSGTTIGTRTLNFTIAPCSLESDALYATLTQNRFEATGAAIRPTLATVKWAGRALTEGTDYSVSYLNNTAPGTGSVVLTGMGNYADARSLDFTIYEPAELSDGAIAQIPPQLYTGSALTPAVTVKLGEQTLTEGWDYTVAYANNTNVGEATVTVTGRGDYIGTATAPFTIAPKDISQCEAGLYKANSYGSNIGEAVYAYSGGENRPKAAVTFNGRQLYENTSYTLSYQNNVNVGTATAVLTGTGNFAGTLELPFTVEPLGLDDLDSASVATEVYNTAAHTPKITMYTQYRDSDGYSQYNYLTEDQDYTILSWTNNVNAGSASVTLEGKGNYTGQRTLDFTIDPMPLQRNDFTVTGTATKVGEDGAELHDLAVVWKRAGQALRQGTDFTVENLYSDSNFAYFYLNGLGNFGGSTGTYSFRLPETEDVTLPIMGSFPAGWMIDKDGVLTIQANGPLNSISYNDQQRSWIPYSSLVKKIVIHEATSISSGLFTECYNLTEVVVVEDDGFYPLTRIDPTTFPQGTSFTFHLPDTITTLDSSFDYIYDNARLFVTPGSTTDATVRAKGYNYFYYEGYPDFQLWTYQGDGDLWLTAYTGSGGAVTIPSFVNVIESSGFSDTYRIDKVIIPASVKTIRNGFLQNSYSLREVVIEPGSNLTELPTHFISGCNDITLYIPDNIQYCPDPINYYTDNDMLIVANCTAPVITSLKGQFRWGDENEKRSGARYRLIHNDLTHHDGQPATCDADGWAPYDTCGSCGYTSYAALPAPGHDWGAPTYAWNSGYTQVTATRVCQRDGSHVESETVTTIPHVTRAATCEEMGDTTYTTNVFRNTAFAIQSRTLTDVSAVGHDWNAPTYTWATDHSSVTARHTCKRNASHAETETVDTEWTLTRSPTETARGQRRYVTKAFANTAFQAQNKTMDDVPALNTLNGLKLPAMLRTIDVEAFRGGTFQYVIVPEGCATIGSRAFADCVNLFYIRIPSTVKTIAQDAFDGCNAGLIIDK